VFEDLSGLHPMLKKEIKTILLSLLQSDYESYTRVLERIGKMNPVFRKTILSKMDRLITVVEGLTSNTYIPDSLSVGSFYAYWAAYLNRKMATQQPSMEQIK
jgi:hypothetical protein